MKTRCLNPNSPRYKDYGARGITVCDEWLKFKPFVKWAVESGYQDGLTLDRIDNNGNYEPSNCKWVSMKENQNNRRNNILVAYKGQTKTVAEWSETTGIPYHTLLKRVKVGDTGDRLFRAKGIWNKR